MGRDDELEEEHSASASRKKHLFRMTQTFIRRKRLISKFGFLEQQESKIEVAKKEKKRMKKKERKRKKKKKNVNEKKITELVYCILGLIVDITTLIPMNLKCQLPILLLQTNLIRTKTLNRC